MPRKLLADSYRGWYGWEGQNNSMLRMKNYTVWECQHKMDLERFRHQLEMDKLQAAQVCREMSAKRAYCSLQDEYSRIRAEQAVLQTHAFTSYDPTGDTRPRTDKPVPSAKLRARAKRRPKTERTLNQLSGFHSKQFQRNSLPSIGSAEFSALKERKRPEKKNEAAPVSVAESRGENSTWNLSSPAEVTTLIELQTRKRATPTTTPTTTATRSRKQATGSSRKGMAMDSDVMNSTVQEEEEESKAGDVDDVGVNDVGDDDVFYGSNVSELKDADLVTDSDKDKPQPSFHQDGPPEETLITEVVGETLLAMPTPENRPGKEPSADSFQSIGFILEAKKKLTADSGRLTPIHFVKPSSPKSTARPSSLHPTTDVPIPHDVTRTPGKRDSSAPRTFSPLDVSQGDEVNSLTDDKITNTVTGKGVEQPSLQHDKADVKNTGVKKTGVKKTGVNIPTKNKHEKQTEVLRSPRPGSIANHKQPITPTPLPRPEADQMVLVPLLHPSSPYKRSAVDPAVDTDLGNKSTDLGNKSTDLGNKSTDLGNNSTETRNKSVDDNSKPDTAIVSPRQHQLSPTLKPVHASNSTRRTNENCNSNDKPQTADGPLPKQQLSPRVNPTQASSSHTSDNSSVSNNNSNIADTTVVQHSKQPSSRPQILDKLKTSSSNNDNNTNATQPGAAVGKPGFRLAQFRKAAEVIIEEKRIEKETNVSVFAALFMHKTERQRLKLRPVEKPACVQEEEKRTMWQELLLNVQGAVRWKAKMLREKEGIPNTRQMRKKAQEDQQARERSRRHVFPGQCKTTYAMKKFLSKEINDLVDAWRPENVRRTRNKQMVQRATLPEFVDRTRSTTAILKDFKKYQSKHEDVGAG